VLLKIALGIESVPRVADGDRDRASHAVVSLDELSLAYVLSIHKSQGSEFPCIVIPLHTQHFLMLQRNLLYTAVTRGKKPVALLRTKKALSMAVRRVDTGQRHTALRKRLHELQ
jgi:exodeoxyribonuclease V alpha subunit